MLPGLDGTAGQQIFADRGCLPIAPLEWAEVDRYCGGNPLAFQLIAAKVQEVADGDVSEIFPYLRSSKLGFADIHILIQQQWERLTSEEHQVMYWLAIAREPLAIVDLEAVLHPAWNRQAPSDWRPDSKAERTIAGNSSLLTVLQSLRRRSIISTISRIDRDKHHWSLPKGGRKAPAFMCGDERCRGFSKRAFGGKLPPETSRRLKAMPRLPSGRETRPHESPVLANQSASGLEA